jgi:hypothetical protein
MKQGIKPIFSTHLERGWFVCLKEGNALFKTLVLIPLKNLFYGYNNPSSSFGSSFQKNQFQGLNSNFKFSIFYTFGLNTTKPNLEP